MHIAYVQTRNSKLSFKCLPDKLMYVVTICKYHVRSWSIFFFLIPPPTLPTSVVLTNLLNKEFVNSVFCVHIFWVFEHLWIWLNNFNFWPCTCLNKSWQCLLFSDMYLLQFHCGHNYKNREYCPLYCCYHISKRIYKWQEETKCHVELSYIYIAQNFTTDRFSFNKMKFIGYAFPFFINWA